MLRGVAIIAFIACLLFMSWIGLHFLTKVGPGDVIAYNSFQRSAPSGNRQLLAGDVVILYDNGDMVPICDLNLDQANFTDTDLTSFYVNTLAESLPFFERVATAFRKIATDKADSESPQGASRTEPGAHLVFEGKERSLREVSSAPISDTCQCKMARWASRGIRVCTVNAALVETRHIRRASGDQLASRTVAVTLARHTNYVMPAQFEACGIPVTPEAKLVQQSLCNEHDELPLDVRARRMLNLIAERPYTPIAARVN